MPTFSAPDGTVLSYRTAGGEGGAPLVCLPGGPMRASAYLGDLGGLAAHRRLVLLDLRGTGGSAVPEDRATYRVDRQVPDVEALRVHLGLDRMDLLAHSAAGDLALGYAAAHPGRVRSLTLVTARGRVLGVEFTPDHRREAASLRAGEPWYPAAANAFEKVLAGTATDADWDAVAPLFYGRWDAAAQAHSAADVEQSNEEAGERYAAAGAFDPSAARAAISALTAPVLLYAGELDGGPRPRVAAAMAAMIPGARLVVQPGGGHFPWLDDPAHFTRTVAAFLDEAEPA
ncbi:Pimeloyl-ACP methyl ester carboxylesterase [Actinacidiphila rubida]|uniref:Pimeloyl-ACP methyl ester carboxylesterase n=2 Tax=Actinacidiphila rubida TaxID=310780 RepID=A0A1H8HEZ9_9ACTN|nr:alpha/beta hydrolase [Actinacidiphila rubida]SEN54534.1 Pimeloyl-ACP methyl ester carboxylesterase [Actinacidiphila rubida]